MKYARLAGTIRTTTLKRWYTPAEVLSVVRPVAVKAPSSAVEATLARDAASHVTATFDPSIDLVFGSERPAVATAVIPRSRTSVLTSLGTSALMAAVSRATIAAAPSASRPNADGSATAERASVSTALTRDQES